MTAILRSLGSEVKFVLHCRTKAMNSFCKISGLIFVWQRGLFTSRVLRTTIAFKRAFIDETS